MKFAVFALVIFCGANAIELSVLPNLNQEQIQISHKPLLTNEGFVQISQKPLLNGDSSVVISQKPILNGDSNVVISQKPIFTGENIQISQKPIFHETTEDVCDVCFSQLKELVGELSKVFNA